MRKKLKELRIKRGFPTQKKFAEELNISVNTYKNIESGNGFPREELLYKILNKLGETDISLMQDEKKAYKSGEVSENICKLMNKQSLNTFTINDISKIRKSVKDELKERKNNCIKIKYNSTGKINIYKRIAIIANRQYGMNISYLDVKLYKECCRIEYEERTGKSTWSIPEVRKKLGYDPKTNRRVAQNE